MKKVGFIFIIFLLFSNLFGWGGLAHRIITEQAMKNLPPEMNLTTEWKEYIVEHCSDPDKRKKETPGEFEKHFIDIDFYEEFNRGEMITSKEALIEKYGEEDVHKMGLLPWTILETYSNLITAFKEQNKDDILLYSSDLAHYVEDASQPLHTVLNYDGQLTGQDGIHGRHEGGMIKRYETEIRKNLQYTKASKLEVDLDYNFNLIADSNSLAPLIFEADKHALKYTTDYDEEYYRLLWYKTEYMVLGRNVWSINQM